MVSILTLVIILIIGLPVAGALGYMLSRKRNAGEAAAAKAEADKILATARRQAASIEKEAELKGGQKLAEKERSFEEATRTRRQETARSRKRRKTRTPTSTGVCSNASGPKRNCSNARPKWRGTRKA